MASKTKANSAEKQVVAELLVMAAVEGWMESPKELFQAPNLAALAAAQVGRCTRHLHRELLAPADNSTSGFSARRHGTDGCSDTSDVAYQEHLARRQQARPLSCGSLSAKLASSSSFHTSFQQQAWPFTPFCGNDNGSEVPCSFC